MKQIKIYYLLIASAFITLLASCHKDKEVQKSDTPTAERAGIYILNQGGIGHNNSTLTYYDYTSKQLVPDQFNVANNDKLGDTGNDMGIYGSKMFIVVNNSDLIDVVNYKNAKLIKKINLNQPRSVVFYKSNAFITSYNGTVSVIDTTSLTITNTITVGRTPEQIAISNNKLYVANSGGIPYGNPDNTVSVVDLNTFKEIKKITVISDPVSIISDSFNNVYVLSYGFGNVLAGMTIIDTKADIVKPSPTVSLGYSIPIYSQGDFVYYATSDPITFDNKIAVYNAKTQTVAQANFITDGTTIQTPYAISGDPNTGEVFITDAVDYASNGTLYAFDKTGKKEYAIQVGISPGKVILLNK